MYNSGVSVSSVNTNIDTALRALFAAQGFSAWIQFSDVIQAVHNVAGVDNVRFALSSDDATNHGIKTKTATGTVIATFDADFALTDEQLPIYFSAVIIRKANNNF